MNFNTWSDPVYKYGGVTNPDPGIRAKCREQIHHLEPGRRDRHEAGFDLREIEQVVDHLGEVARRLARLFTCATDTVSQLLAPLAHRVAHLARGLTSVPCT